MNTQGAIIEEMLSIDVDQITEVNCLDNATPGETSRVEVQFKDGTTRVFEGADPQRHLRFSTIGRRRQRKRRETSLARPELELCSHSFFAGDLRTRFGKATLALTDELDHLEPTWVP